jgi:ribosomal protein S27E
MTGRAHPGQVKFAARAAEVHRKNSWKSCLWASGEAGFSYRAPSRRSNSAIENGVPFSNSRVHAPWVGEEAALGYSAARRCGLLENDEQFNRVLRQRPSRGFFSLPVAELTGSVHIQLNARLSLRARADALEAGQCPPSVFSVAKPPDHHIPPGGFVLSRSFISSLDFEQVMTNSKTAQVTQAPIRHSRFRIVCIKCDSLGIVFDCPEGAPPSTQIRCRHCGAPRGTLGELRKLSCSDRRDLFEV